MEVKGAYEVIFSVHFLNLKKKNFFIVLRLMSVRRVWR